MSLPVPGTGLPRQLVDVGARCWCLARGRSSERGCASHLPFPVPGTSTAPSDAPVEVERVAHGEPLPVVVEVRVHVAPARLLADSPGPAGELARPVVAAAAAGAVVEAQVVPVRGRLRRAVPPAGGIRLRP